MGRDNHPLFPSQAIRDHLGHNVSLAAACRNHNARIARIVPAVCPGGIDCTFLVIVESHLNILDGKLNKSRVI
jgi:hypothetical protein